MVKRRGYLEAIALLGIGGVGGYAAAETDAISEAQRILRSTAGPPEPDTEINTVTGGPMTTFKRVTFYENGVAEIEIEEGHNAERIGLTHDLKRLPEDAYKIWKAPEFGGPKLVNMRRPIQANGPYPSPEFKLRLLAGRGEVRIAGGDEFSFTVPDSYLP